MQTDVLYDFEPGGHAPPAAPPAAGGVIYREYLPGPVPLFEREGAGQTFCFLFLLHGELAFSVNGRPAGTFVPGQLMFLTAYSLTECRTPAGCTLLCIYGRNVMGTLDWRRCRTLLPMVGPQRTGPKILQVRPPLNHFVRLAAFHARHGAASHELYRDLVRGLFNILWHYYPREELARLLRNVIDKQNKFLLYVWEHYDKTESVDQLVAMSRMTRSAFHRTFKRVFGEPPKQWILKQKMKKMEYLMATTSYQLKEIGHLCGYSTSKGFWQFCLKAYGKPPSELLDCYRAKK